MTTSRQWLTIATLLFAAAGTQAAEPGSVFRDCQTCPEMVVVPAGKFLMGSPATEKGRHPTEGPQQEVTIAKPFAVGRFEVTVAEFREFERETGHRVEWVGEFGGGNRPAVNLSYNDALRYVQWLARKTGQPYRLLSEAEWEYAARAGTTGRFSFPGWDIGKFANTDDSDDHEETAPVGSYPANAFGLHDMQGNVAEWVQDCWHESHDGAANNGSARSETGNCKLRTLRGGSWMAPGQVYARSAVRQGNRPDYHNESTGMRVARSL